MKAVRTIALPAFVCLLNACGSPLPQTSGSRLDTVEIPQSAVEDQGKFGLCWAYGTIGLMESVHKTRTGSDINLSEEAVGFYRLAHALHEMLTTFSTVDLISAFSRPGVLAEGWYPRMPPGFLDKPATGDNMDALDLIKTYGVVPESAWSFKIPNIDAHSLLFSRIRKQGMRFLETHRDRSAVTMDQIIDEILVGPFPSRPPTEFDFNGTHYTAQGFLADHLRFNPDDYVAISARSADDFDKIVDVTKRALVRGISVPLMYPINIMRLHGDMFSGDNLPTDTMGDLVSFTANGGHVVLVTDFVNEGGRAGRVSPEEVDRELRRTPSDLEYLIFKNSWGKRALTNEAGIPLGQGSETGYYRMDQGYLRAAAKVGSYQGWTPLGVVVPRDIVPSLEGAKGSAGGYSDTAAAR